MIAVDTNVLVYAFFSDSPFHTQARQALTRLAEGRAPWAIPWPCIHEFYAVTTNPKIFSQEGLGTAAREQIDEWLRSPSLQLIGETATHWRDLSQILEASRTVGPAVHDARIAAICIGHGVRELLTLDRDFSRFPELGTRSILV